MSARCGRHEFVLYAHVLEVWHDSSGDREAMAVHLSTVTGAVVRARTLPSRKGTHTLTIHLFTKPHTTTITFNVMVQGSGKDLTAIAREINSRRKAAARLKPKTPGAPRLGRLRAFAVGTGRKFARLWRWLTRWWPWRHPQPPPPIPPSFISEPAEPVLAPGEQPPPPPPPVLAPALAVVDDDWWELHPMQDTVLLSGGLLLVAED